MFDFIPDFIDMGVEILNPVQTTARNMDPRTLKREFGNHLVFWGAIDMQRILPFQKPEDVHQEVREKIALLGDGGGYLLAPCHNIQNNTPPRKHTGTVQSGGGFRPLLTAVTALITHASGAENPVFNAC